MKRMIFTNAIILLCAIPISGLIAALALLAGFGPRYIDYSTFGMIIRNAMSPVIGGIVSTHDPIQNIILAGTPLLFLVSMVVSIFQKRPKTSYAFSALASLCWVLIVVLTIYSQALP